MVYYNEKHSITFYPAAYGVGSGGKNTWKDWHLIPSKRPVILPPSVKTDYIDTSSGAYSSFRGLADMSNASKLTLQNRTGDIKFYIDWSYYNNGNWAEHYSEIMNFLQGRNMNIVLEDDPGYFYSGIVSVESFDPSKDFSTITFTYSVEPYKYDIQSSGGGTSGTITGPWLWDPFDFQNGTVNDEGLSNASLAITSQEGEYQFAMRSFNIPVLGSMRTIPIITITINSYDGEDSVIEIQKGTTNNAPVGTGVASVGTGVVVIHPSDFGNLINSPKSFRFSNFVMTEGDNILTFWVRGNIDISIDIDYRGGML